MTTHNLYLFRIKVIKPPQTSLFISDASPSETLKKAILEKPSGEVRKGHEWRIGNLTSIEDDSFYFKLGRISKATREYYDDAKKEFVEQKSKEAPNTDVFVDTALELCAISHKTDVSQKVSTLAGVLCKLLNLSDTARNQSVTFSISDIKDPKQFLEALLYAHSIELFRFTFTKPNPWDVNKDFQEPQEKLVEATQAESGKTELKGENLNKEIISEITSSIAATGNDATAKIKETSDGRAVTKHLRGNLAVVVAEEIATTEDKKTILGKIRALYHRIRGDSE